MIINLCFDANKVLKIIENFKQEKILDFTGVLYLKNIPNKLLLARQIDKNSYLEKKSINFYVETIGKLSIFEASNKKSIRNITIKKIPIYWLTEIAEKHDSFHWGQTIFFFLFMLKEKSELFENNLTIILHSKAQKIQKSLQKSISNINPNINVKFIKTNKKTTPVSITKTWLSATYSFVKNIKIHYKEKISLKTFFFTGNINAVNNNSCNFDIGWQKKILERQNINSYNLPFFHSFKKSINYNKNIKYYTQFAPNIKQIISLWISIFTTYFLLTFKIKNNFQHKFIHIHKDCIKQEFFKVLAKPYFFFNFIWIKNFARNCKEATIYYSDELYSTGRIISEALKINKNITKIGVQHGLILENHTVYRITDTEQTFNNPIPVPDKIIIWDNIFKKRILLNSKIIERKLIINNNAKYNELKIIKKNNPKGTKNILWCTTLPEHFDIETQIIINSNIRHKNLRIRLHPNGFITKDYVDTHIPKEINYTISKFNLITDFSWADIVITNPFSTIFYDAINANLPVIRILHYGTFIDFVNEFKNMFDVWNTEEINKFIK